MVALSLALGSLLAASAAQECTGAATSLALDHVVIVVRDLDQASAPFRAHGFRLKQGRLHSNNLLNRHIKFRDGTSIELMTVQGTPADGIAKDYAELLATGEGAVYVALKTGSAAAAQQVASVFQLETRTSTSGPWLFLSFPPTSPAAAVFFSSGAANVVDPDSLVSHQPDVTGLTEVWLEGGGQLGALLERLGAKRCGVATSPDGRTGERFGLARGTVVITAAPESQRPRVLGVVLRRTTPGENTVYPHPAFWVHYRYERS